MNNEAQTETKAVRTRNRTPRPFMIQTRTTNDNIVHWIDRPGPEHQNSYQATRWAKDNMPEGQVFRVVQIGPMHRVETETVRRNAVVNIHADDN